jgi:hypothetical protein
MLGMSRAVASRNPKKRKLGYRAVDFCNSRAPLLLFIGRLQERA